MTAEPLPRAWSSRFERSAGRELSVLIPFKDDDPRPLLTALAKEIAAAPALIERVEIVLYDDGSSVRSLPEVVGERVQALDVAATLISDPINRGRSTARNRLRDAAGGRYVLFLDADMLPDRDDFIATWLAEIDTQAPGATFGGYSVAQVEPRPEFALHRALFEVSECPSAAMRNLAPARYVYTSNLLVRGDVLADVGFDTDFVGWGWEDVDWGARAQARVELRHIDNPATHLGLDTPEQLLAKYERSGPNFARLAARHPALVADMPAFKAARWFARWPILRRFSPAFSAIVKDRWGLAPMRVRVLALKLWKASWNGAALS